MSSSIKNIYCHICVSPVRKLVSNLIDDRYGSPERYTIVICDNCSFGRTIPTLDEKKIGLFYSKYYPLSHMSVDDVQKSVDIKPMWYEWLAGNGYIAHRHIKKGSKVLDIGSGNGMSLLEIARLGGKPYGIEPDPNAQNIARKLNLNVQKGFITDNPFPKIKFDFITASQVLEHDPHPELFLQNAYKKLNPGGQVILSFPNINSLYRKIFKRNWLHWHVPYHINFFSEKSFTMLANRCGYRIIKMKTITNNLWTILQLSMLLTQKKEGEMNQIWKTQHMDKEDKQNLNFRLKKVIFEVGRIILSPFIIVMNRTIDTFGQGDSIYVILEKSK